MVRFPLNMAQWMEGLRYDNYVDTMDTYQVEMKRRRKMVQLLPDEIALFSRLDHPIKIAALSEDWCIDCLMTLPIIAKIAEASIQFDLRIFSRAKWPELKTFYNGREIFAIPVYSFLVDDFTEVGCLIERPKRAHIKVGEWKAAHPEVDEIRRAAHLSSEEKKARLAQIRLGFQAEMEDWYVGECQAALVAEVAVQVGLV